MSSDRRDENLATSDLQEQQRQQHGNAQPAKTGEGSGSAMTAMLKKRRQGENHPDDAVAENGIQPAGRAN